MINLTNENFEKEVIQSKIPVIIDFGAEWCMPCKMIAPIFEEMSKEYEGKLKFAKVNTDKTPNIASKFNIRGIPALIITKNGKEIDRIVGFLPKQALKQKIDQILGF